MSLLIFDAFPNGVPKPEWSPAANLQQGRFPTQNNSLGSGGSVLTIPASAKVTVGFAHNGATWTGATTKNFVDFRADAGAVTHLTVGYNASRQITLRLGGPTGTLLATSTYAFPISEWRHMQVQATIADAAGRCIVKVDDVVVLDYTGDTKNGGTSTNIDRLGFIGDAGGNTRWSDLWVVDGVDATATQGRANNDFLGDLKATIQYPNGNGASSQFVGSDGNSVDNYLLVDDPTLSNTDYVGSAVVGNRDLYAVQDLPTTATEVYGIRAASNVAKSDAGAASIKQLIREASGTITDDAGAYALSTTFTSLLGPLRPTTPGTATPWTVADVNGLQIGVEVA